MSKTKIVLNVSGGVVQDVFCSAPDAEVILVDWNVEGCNSSEDGIVEIVDGHGRGQYAEIRQCCVFPLRDLSGTDVQKALEKAGMLPDLPNSGKSEVRKYILYDFDADDLATTNVYDSYPEAADDASELDNVIVVPLVFEKVAADAVEPETTEPRYHITIDGPVFRSQRELLLKLHGLTGAGIPYSPASGDQELLEGLIGLTDELADQAHDNHGVDCLLDVAEEQCDCEQPGYFCSGVPGILAHMEGDRLAPGAKVERCDLCRRYPTDEAALKKLRELGHGTP